MSRRRVRCRRISSLRRISGAQRQPALTGPTRHPIRQGPFLSRQIEGLIRAAIGTPSRSVGGSLRRSQTLEEHTDSQRQKRRHQDEMRNRHERREQGDRPGREQPTHRAAQAIAYRICRNPDRDPPRGLAITADLELSDRGLHGQAVGRPTMPPGVCLRSQTAQWRPLNVFSASIAATPKQPRHAVNTTSL